MKYYKWLYKRMKIRQNSLLDLRLVVHDGNDYYRIELIFSNGKSFTLKPEDVLSEKEYYERLGLK